MRKAYIANIELKFEDGTELYNMLECDTPEECFDYWRSFIADNRFQLRGMFGDFGICHFKINAPDLVTHEWALDLVYFEIDFLM